MVCPHNAEFSNYIHVSFAVFFRVNTLNLVSLFGSNTIHPITILNENECLSQKYEKYYYKM